MPRGTSLSVRACSLRPRLTYIMKFPHNSFANLAETSAAVVIIQSTSTSAIWKSREMFGTTNSICLPRPVRRMLSEIHRLRLFWNRALIRLPGEYRAIIPIRYQASPILKITWITSETICRARFSRCLIVLTILQKKKT